MVAEHAGKLGVGNGATILVLPVGLRVERTVDHHILWHVLKLVDQPLAVHLGQDAALIVIPV